MKKNELHILHLYPRDMNIYGDNGNVLAIEHRARKHGLQPIVRKYNQGDRFPRQVDIVIGGGGQDSGQLKVLDDLHRIASKLHKLADSGTPILFVCGLYQLAGHEFVTQGQKNMKGIDLLDIKTKAGDQRLTGNVVATSREFGQLVGYENHSGQTTLGDYAAPLATVIKGVGNNVHDKHEGARQQNIIGTYLHGSFLPKNPKVTDWLIATAIQRKNPDFKLATIDDTLVEQARLITMKRPR